MLHRSHKFLIYVFHIFLICISLLSNLGWEKLVIFNLNKSFYNWITLREMNTKNINSIFLIIRFSIHKIDSSEFTYLSTIFMVFIKSLFGNRGLLSELLQEILGEDMSIFLEDLFAFNISNQLLIFILYVTDILLNTNFRL